MIYVLAHTPHAEPWIATRPRLYAYPKPPDVSGDALVLLDSGAFGLSLRGQRIDAAHMVKLAAHYRQYAGGHVVPIAPDEFLNPARSMSNFEHWHEHHAIPVAPVVQMRRERHFDAMSVQRQLAFYKRFPLPTFAGRPVVCFSNAGWRAIEFERHASGLRLALRMHFPDGVWLHNLGAGWDVHDIRTWAALDVFASIDSIAWYTDANAGKSWGPGDDRYRANADAAQERNASPLVLRHATPDDVAAIKCIAGQYRNELGFVNRTAILERIGKNTVMVVCSDGVVIGFVDYNATRRGPNAGYSVVYHLAVARTWTQRGAGRLLLSGVPRPIRLKVTLDNAPAQAFYDRLGFRRLHIDPGKTRPLAVYEKS